MSNAGWRTVVILGRNRSGWLNPSNVANGDVAGRRQAGGFDRAERGGRERCAAGDDSGELRVAESAASSADSRAPVSTPSKMT